MEDAILENSKGATYLSFILDVEIVIKKEGRANVAETRVKNRNTRESNEGSQDRGRAKSPETNKKQDVYLVAGNQTNLRDIGNQKKTDEWSFVKNSSILNQNNTSLTQRQKYKSFLSNETNISDTSSEKHHKRKRIHKGNSSKMFKGKVEPIDFLECNRIFVCNYLQLPRYNSDSVLQNKSLQQEYLDMFEEQLKNTTSVSEIPVLLKHNNSSCNENIDKLVGASTKDLGNIDQQSSGDYNVTETHKTNEKNLKNLYFSRQNINVELFHRYLKKAFLTERTVERNKNQFFTNNKNINFQYDLSSGTSPGSHGVITLKNKVESLPNIKIELKSDSGNFSSDVKDPEDQLLTDSMALVSKFEEPQNNSTNDFPNVKVKCCTSTEKTSPTSEEAVQLIQDNYSNMKATAFLQRIKNVKKSLSFSYPIKLSVLGKRIFKKNPK